MAPPADDSDITPGELRRTLARLEQRVDKLDGKVELVGGKVASLDTDIRDRLDRIDRVSYREWEDARKADRSYADETRAIATSARAWVWAMFALVCAAVMAAGFALVKSV